MLMWATISYAAMLAKLRLLLANGDAVNGVNGFLSLEAAMLWTLPSVLMVVLSPVEFMLFR